MRKLSVFLNCMAAAGMLFLTGCNNEESLINNEIPVETGKLSFVIPFGSGKTVTYATPPDILQGDSLEYELKELFIYWFKDGDASGGTPATDKLEQVFTMADGGVTLTNAVSATNSTTVASIDVGNDNSPSKFYIVANVNGSSAVGSTGLTVGTSPGQLTVGQSTRADFEAALTNELATSGDDIVLPHTPLPMSINAGGATPDGYVPVAQPASQGLVSGDVHMKRRVARFDILNNSDFSNFVITKVYVSNAQKTGWVHDRAGVASGSWAPANVGKFAIADAASGGTRNLNGTRLTPDQKQDLVNGGVTGTATDSIPDGIIDGFQPPHSVDSLERAKAVFYLYPTTLAADGSKTEIKIEGTRGGKPMMYSLDLTAGDVDIEANKLYTIVVERYEMHQLYFRLVVDPWEDGAPSREIPANGTGAGVTAWGSAVADDAAATTLDLSDLSVPTPFEYTSADTVTLTIVQTGTVKTGPNGHVSSIAIEAQGTAGTDYLQTDATATASGSVTSVTNTTYGGVYTTTHTVKLPPTDAPLRAKLTIIDAGNQQKTKVMNLFCNNHDKKGEKLEIGTALSATEALSAGGRWTKAVVTSVGANGFPAQVYALLGQTTISNLTNFSNYRGGTPLEQLEWLKANQGAGSLIIPVSPATETYSASLANGAQVVPAEIVSNIVTAFSLINASGTITATYRAIVVNFDKSTASSGQQLPVLASDGTLNVRSTSSDIISGYNSSYVTALIDF